MTFSPHDITYFKNKIRHWFQQLLHSLLDEPFLSFGCSFLYEKIMTSIFKPPVGLAGGRERESFDPVSTVRRAYVTAGQTIKSVSVIS